MRFVGRALALVLIVFTSAPVWSQGEIVQAPRAGASSEDPEAIAWLRANHHAIRSGAGADNFDDLQFLKPLLEGRRIIQIGESHHMVAEYGTTKTRLIKFLHQEMGFDVLAFESSIYECFAADLARMSPAEALNASIFGVWATEEVRGLFDYLKASQATSRPLIFRGFDPQISSRTGVATRPAFFRRLIEAIDADYAAEVFAFDTMVLDRFSRDSAAFARAEEPRLVAFYERLSAFFASHRERLQMLFPAEEAPLVAERTAWSMIRHVQQLRSFLNDNSDASMDGHMAIRDGAMADNISFLARDLYPDKKIIVWAANIHVRHASEQTSWQFPTMGGWLAERFRDELYTIGLYANRGRVNSGTRAEDTIEPAPDGTMEHLLSQMRAPVLFVDFLHAGSEPGTKWMFESIPTRDAELFVPGMRTVPIVPRDQYDGVLLFDTVSPPRFLSR